MWLLLYITLVFSPTPHVVDVRVVEFFENEQKCIKKIQEIPKEEIPPTVNMGCVPLNGRKI